jgi:two-component system OmpR family response regulator
MPEVVEERVAVVVEDDEDIRQLLEATLRQGGFTVHSTASGREGVELVRHARPVVTTLDVSLPDIDGLEVARRVRTFSDAYIVMLTARAEEIDTLLGLEAGADDYLTKPFRPRELRARIEAMLRRPRAMRVVEPEATPASGPAPATAESGPAGDDSPAPAGPTATTGATDGGTPVAPADPGTEDGDVLVHQGLRLDTAARLAHLDGTPIHLTRSEFEILSALLAARGRVLSKSDLVRGIWSEDYDTGLDVTDADRRAVEVHIANLRRKLGEDPGAPRFIGTVRGVGYRLAQRPS